MYFTSVFYFTLPWIAQGILIDGNNNEHSLIFSIPEADTSNPEFTNEFKSINLIRRKRSNGDPIELIAFKIESIIRYRYSRTYVTSHVRNSDENQGKEVTFQVILPETAFISKFLMEIDGKTYEAYVKEKEEAKKDYQRAQSRGQSAGLLELNARHSNVFNVNVNIKANSIVNFNLTYEELLSRRFGRYEQILNINGNEVSKTSDVEVLIDIEESQGLTMVKALNLQNEIDAPEISKSDNPDAKITKPKSNRAIIKWKPNSKFDSLKRFIVQYDVERELDSGEVLIMNGYFVHFFAPPNLKPLQKHVVFVLDVSGSMSGRKIEQLKEAMRKILKELKKDDYFNIIIFSTDVVMWKPGDRYESNTNWQFGRRAGGGSMISNNPNQPFPANSQNLEQAKSYVDSLIAQGSTNINDAITQALNLTALIRRTRKQVEDKRHTRDTIKIESEIEVLPPRVETLILFLTDGEPTVGVTDLTSILKNIQLGNMGLSVPIFSLAFGQGADFNFLRKLSLQNFAFARKIYEAADAALQLEGFYTEISSPLLSNVEFNYTSTADSPYSVDELTRHKFPTYFDGWEIAVAGKMKNTENSGSGNEDEGGIRTKRSVAKYSSPHMIRYMPTDHCHFSCSVHGIGHDGIHHWRRPLIYAPHHPWWCDWPPPPRPTTTTTPRPPQSQEDNFLERLWAYLTIQNLIEKDMEGKGEYGESPKQRALRLALKYGFVTAQTSLVVVKPETSDVANAESTDQRTQGFSNSSPGMSLMAMGNGGSGGGGMRKFAAARPMMHKKSGGATSVQSDYDDGSSSKMDAADMTSASASTSTHRTESTTNKKSKDKTNSKPRKSNNKYTVNDIKWLKDGKFLRSNENGEKEYRVAMSEKEVSNSSGVGNDCDIGKSRSKLNKVTGTCQHLKDCIKEEILDDFDTYSENYFCPIKSTSSADVNFAGICCDEVHQ